MTKLHWEELTNADILVTENEAAFVNDVKTVKMCYITDGRKFFAGIDDRMMFFVNGMCYDFKLHQRPLRFFQYKTARTSLTTNVRQILHVVGVEAEGDHGLYRYALIVSQTGDVSVDCESLDENGAVVDHRSMILRGSVEW